MNVLKTTSVLILCFIAGTFYAKAQSNEFAPIGAKWHYTYLEGNNNSYSTIESIKDTVVAGINSRILIQKFYADKNILSQNPARQFIIYSDSGRVYLWQDSFFTKLYDFTLKVGDTYEYKYKNGKTFNFKVIDIENRLVDGQNRKAFFIRHHEYDFSAVLEGIGSYDVFTPEGDVETDRIETKGLRCYIDNKISFAPSTCDTVMKISGVKEFSFEESNQITISPNPFQDNININLKPSFNNNSGQLNISIYSLDGKKVFETNSATENINLNLSRLAKGIYTLRVKANNYFLNKTIVKL